MSFNWVEYVKLAEDLQKQRGESYLRSSISRAYYGVFCIARNKKGYKNSRQSNVHWEVINAYKNSSIQDEKYVGKLLDDLRKQRNDADYDEDKTISAALAQRVILKSKIILKILGIPL